MKYCEDDKSAKLRVLLCNRSLCLATTCCCCCCCCCLFVGDVGRDRGVAEGIRFTGLVGRDAADDDRRTGLVFLERGVATRTSTTSTPRMLQLLLVVDLNAETAIFSSSSSRLSVCLLSSYFFPQKKKIPMSCIHIHNNNKRAKAKSRLLLPTSYYYRLSSRAKEKRSAISLSLSPSLSLSLSRSLPLSLSLSLSLAGWLPSAAPTVFLPVLGGYFKNTAQSYFVQMLARMSKLPGYLPWYSRIREPSVPVL